MTKQEGQGVSLLLNVVDAALRQTTDEPQVRSLIDGLDDAELGAVLLGIAAAKRAEGDSDLLLESAAARLMGRNVAIEGSAVPS